VQGMQYNCEHERFEPLKKLAIALLGLLTADKINHRLGSHYLF
jgi:hypothetical protein